MTRECVTEDELQVLLEGTMDSGERERLEAHFDACEPCRSLLAAAVRALDEGDAGPRSAMDPARPPGGGEPREHTAPTLGGAGRRSDPRRLRGASLGRYVILGLLGEGATGSVLAAYDPQLDRRVAIKVLHRGDARRAPSNEMRERALREARALARVVHPNIVAVHDADYHGDELYVVMELIDGVTLHAWLDVRARTMDAIRGVFLQAGRGLAAAHAAGLVHRDFKPDNVLVGADHRVRVADFGLARVRDAAGAVATEVPRFEPAPGEGTPPEGPGTRAGTILGTPAYMAPEQHAGAVVDARADQFAFCVALYKALTKQRPYDGDGYEALARNVREGRLREAPLRALPAWLRALLVRGLSVDPAARYPSMEALLAVLAVDPVAARARRLRRLGLSAALVVVSAAAAVGWTRGAARLDPPCATAPAELGAEWNDRARGRIGQAFGATGRPYAADAARRVAARLDDYGAAWVAMRGEACEATRVRGTQSREALDLRMRCLDWRLLELRALVGALTVDVSGELVDRAVTLASELRPLAACADVEALAAVVPLPTDPAVRARVQDLRARLATAGAHARTLRHRDGLALAGPAVDDARALGQAPLLAEALMTRAHLERAAGALAAAEATLREALPLAAAARDDHALVDILVELGDLVGHMGARLEEAATMRPFVEAVLARAGADDIQRAAWATIEGNVAILENSFDAARRHYQLALDLQRRALGDEHPSVARALTDLGYTYRMLGDYAESQRHEERALRLQEKVLGPEHLTIATTLTTLGLTLVDQARFEEAEAAYRRALDILARTVGLDHGDASGIIGFAGHLLLRRGDHAGARRHLERALAQRERDHGSEHISVARVLVPLGRLEVAEGRFDEAGADFRRAQRIFEKVHGSAHPLVAGMLGQLGALQLARGRPDLALPLARRDLEVAVKAFGPRHRSVGEAAVRAGLVWLAMGRLAEAARDFEQGRGVLESALGPDHPDVAQALLGLADILVREGRPAEAVAPLERAVRLRVPGRCAPAERAAAQLALAHALAAARRDPERVRILDREARAVLALAAQPGSRASPRRRPVPLKR